MADVRSLLRQQRAARRIEHPHAAYSDAGKLLCILCRERIKSDSLWDGHVSGPRHMTNLETAPEAPADRNGSAAADGASSSNKRKHDSDEDGEEGDATEAVRKKRSRTDMSTPARPPVGESDRDRKESTLTPPLSNRRMSTTPVQGVEMKIPSRPHTPAHKDGVSPNATPSLQPVGPSPLAPQETAAATATGSSAAAVPVSKEIGAAHPKGGSGGGDVDEDEWAAFEADIAAATAPYSEDAVIAVPAMTADETAAAAKTEAEEREKRRLAAEKDLLDEKEEATRALETEFEDMEELEARVRRLKEKREALRLRADTNAAAPGAKPAGATGKVKIEAPGVEEDEDKNEDEDDEDEDDEDDFMGFRYRS